MIGRIYIIKSPQTDEVYIGSTVNSLERRLSGHKTDYKKYLKGVYHYVTSYEIVQYDDCYIELLEEVNIENKQELHKLEGKYIKEMECVNQCIPGRSMKEYYQDNKELISEKGKDYRDANKEKMKERYKNRYQDNKEKFLEKMKDYYYDNKDKVLERVKNHYQDNKEKIKEYSKEYNINNKERISERNKVKMTCECGSIVRKSDINRHNRTIKHKKYMDNINEVLKE